MDTYITRYFLGIEGLGEFEVDKAKWVQAERACGFRPRYGRPYDEPCTGGFSKGPFTGRIQHDKIATPEEVFGAEAVTRVKDLTGRTWKEGDLF